MLRKILKWGLVAKFIGWLHRMSTDDENSRDT